MSEFFVNSHANGGHGTVDGCEIKQIVKIEEEEEDEKKDKDGAETAAFHEAKPQDEGFGSHDGKSGEENENEVERQRIKNADPV